jgi:hypothetical protein
VGESVKVGVGEITPVGVLVGVGEGVKVGVGEITPVGVFVGFLVGVGDTEPVGVIVGEAAPVGVRVGRGVAAPAPETNGKKTRKSATEKSTQTALRSQRAEVDSGIMVDSFHCFYAHGFIVYTFILYTYFLPGASEFCHIYRFHLRPWECDGANAVRASSGVRR